MKQDKIITRPVHLYEPVILEEENKEYMKWQYSRTQENMKESYPYKYNIKTYSEHLDKDPKELFPTLKKCSPSCKICKYYKKTIKL